jgi:hypothetical protein
VLGPARALDMLPSFVLAIVHSTVTVLAVRPIALVPKLRLGTKLAKLRFASEFPGVSLEQSRGLSRNGVSKTAFPNGVREREHEIQKNSTTDLCSPTIHRLAFSCRDGDSESPRWREA